MTISDAGDSKETAERLAFIRGELRFELRLLHDRVNALVAAEAFLTVAFAVGMGDGAPWGARFAAIVSPILSVLGLLLALLAWPGIETTVKIVLRWTASEIELSEREPTISPSAWGLAMRSQGNRRVDLEQQRGLLYFRAVPGLFVLVWAALTVIAMVIVP